MAKKQETKNEGEAQAGSMNLIRKITVRDVMGADFIADLAEHVKPGHGKTAWLVRIIGVANKAKPGMTDKGEYVKFVGDFEATNLVTGEEMHSAACILPQFIGEQIWGAMNSDGTEKMSTFAFDIGAHYDASSVTKYVYDVKALIAPKSNSLLAELKASVPAIRALPAPAKAA